LEDEIFQKQVIQARKKKGKKQINPHLEIQSIAPRNKARNAAKEVSVTNILSLEHDLEIEKQFQKFEQTESNNDFVLQGKEDQLFQVSFSTDPRPFGLNPKQLLPVAQLQAIDSNQKHYLQRVMVGVADLCAEVRKYKTFEGVGLEENV